MSATAPPRPEYVGGPLCGDPISVNAPSVVRVINPLVGGKNASLVARGTFVYHRVEASGDFALSEVKS